MPALGLGTENFSLLWKSLKPSRNPSCGIRAFLRAGGILSGEQDLCSAPLCVGDPPEGLGKPFQGAAWPYLQQFSLSVLTSLCP